MNLISSMLTRLTAQDVFDIAAWQLLNQGEQARRGTRCRYRGERGLRCAVGFFVPDDQYCEEFEGNGVAGLIAIAEACGCDLQFVRFLARHLGLLSALQRVHDETPPYEWPTRLVEVAHAYHLYPTVVDHWRRAIAERREPYDRLVDEILVEFPATLRSPPQKVRAVEYAPEVVKAPYDVYIQPTQAREAATA